MGDQLVKLLGPTCYRTFVSPVSGKESGQEFVHIATIDDPGAGIYQAYAKLYHPSVINKAVFNEIAGFLFAEALKLPQPERAWVVNTPLDMLPNEIMPAWLKTLQSQGATEYPAFATSRVNGPSAALEITGGLELQRLIDDVRKWNQLPNAVSLDNTITNVDRHLNNLLRVGKNRYTLIDNGRLAHDFGMWNPSGLDVGINYENKLCTIVWAKAPTSDELDKATLGAREHLFGFTEIVDELKQWGGLLLEGAERDAFLLFLEERAKAAEALLVARYMSAA